MQTEHPFKISSISQINIAMRVLPFDPCFRIGSFILRPRCVFSKEWTVPTEHKMTLLRDAKQAGEGARSPPCAPRHHAKIDESADLRMISSCSRTNALSPSPYSNVAFDNAVESPPETFMRFIAAVAQGGHAVQYFSDGANSFPLEWTGPRHTPFFP